MSSYSFPVIRKNIAFAVLLSCLALDLLLLSIGTWNQMASWVFQSLKRGGNWPTDFQRYQGWRCLGSNHRFGCVVHWGFHDDGCREPTIIPPSSRCLGRGLTFNPVWSLNKANSCNDLTYFLELYHDFWQVYLLETNAYYSKTDSRLGLFAFVQQRIVLVGDGNISNMESWSFVSAVPAFRSSPGLLKYRSRHIM